MKNIIFDLGSVINKGKPIDSLKKLNLDENTYNILKRFFEENWLELNYGRITLEEKYKNSNFPKEYDIYKNNLVEYYKYRDIDLELMDLISKLKENNYDIYILSNNNKESVEYLKNNDLFKNIDGWVVSCDYEVKKPDSKIYEILLEKYNLIPEECYFIDDKEKNIEIAKILGIKGYIYNENEDKSKLYEDMRRNNINI